MTKKLLSLLLVAVMLFAVAAPTLAAVQTAKIPVVLVGGRGTKLVNAEGKQIYPHNINTKDYILENCKTLLPMLAKSIVTDNYEEYCDSLYTCIASLYTEMVLDENGEVTNGSDSDWVFTDRSVIRSLSKEQKGINDLPFYYDWRLDLVEIADELAAYIDLVCKYSGHDKIILIGRCMGGNIVTAYLQKYGNEKVSKVLFYETTAMGTSSYGIPFSGSYELYGDGLTRYLCGMLDNSETSELIRALVELCNNNYTLNLGTAAITAIYNKIAPLIEKRLLFNTYASYPSYWEMVDDEHYIAAKNLVFGNDAKYAKFIEKIDYYHYNVLLRVEDILKNCEKNGLEIYNICKYGKQFAPLGDTYAMLSDDTVELKYSSFGATCSQYGSTLNEQYIALRTQQGKQEYISPDKQVDASTCLFPDTTWYVKNITHMNFCDDIDKMIFDILWYKGTPTVDTMPGYTRFMVYIDETDSIAPMTEENMATDIVLPGYFESLVNFIRLLIKFINNYIAARTPVLYSR